MVNVTVERCTGPRRRCWRLRDCFQSSSESHATIRGSTVPTHSSGRVTDRWRIYDVTRSGPLLTRPYVECHQGVSVHWGGGPASSGWYDDHLGRPALSGASCGCKLRRRHLVWRQPTHVGTAPARLGGRTPLPPGSSSDGLGGDA